MGAPDLWTPEDLAPLVASVARSQPGAGGTRVVAVDGPSGSGKSTLATALAVALARALGGAADLGLGEVSVLRLDDLYPGWDGLEAAVPRLVQWVLEPLARGEVPRYRRHDWVTGADAEWHDLPTGPALVVEGCGSGARACTSFRSLLVWLEAPAEVRRQRGITRDGEAYRPHWERWARQEQVHFARERTRARADVRLTTG